MPRRLTPTRRLITAATWPVGVALTSWDYMWRSTPLHRREDRGLPPVKGSALLEFPADVSTDDVQSQEAGRGPLFHRRYSTKIRSSAMTPEQVMREVKANLNRPAPTTFARFEKIEGELGELRVGDEYIVRMPGPWDGPVRVIDTSTRSFRFATLTGHLEAGQIEFSASEDSDGLLVFEIESWARSASRLTNLLYHHLRMSKEVQAHMWISFLEGVVELAEGKMTGGVAIKTERIE